MSIIGRGQLVQHVISAVLRQKLCYLQIFRIVDTGNEAFASKRAAIVFANQSATHHMGAEGGAAQEVADPCEGRAKGRCWLQIDRKVVMRIMRGFCLTLRMGPDVHALSRIAAHICIAQRRHIQPRAAGRSGKIRIIGRDDGPVDPIAATYRTGTHHCRA